MTDRMQSILRLALHESTGETEWQAAAIMFVRLLRKDKHEAEHIRLDAKAKPHQQQQQRRPDPWADAFERARQQREQEEARRQAQQRQAPPPGAGYQNNRTPDMNYRMPFGKHRGNPLYKTPTDYIYWMLNNIPDLDTRLKAKLQAEYNSRFNQP